MSDNPSDYLYGHPDQAYGVLPLPPLRDRPQDLLQESSAEFLWPYLLILITVAIVSFAVGDLAGGNAGKTATSAGTGPAPAAQRTHPAVAPSATAAPATAAPATAAPATAAPATAAPATAAPATSAAAPPPTWRLRGGTPVAG
jgi:hypothetical protein